MCVCVCVCIFVCVVYLYVNVRTYTNRMCVKNRFGNIGKKFRRHIILKSIRYLPGGDPAGPEYTHICAPQFPIVRQ